MKRLNMETIEIGDTYEGIDSAGDLCSICIVGFSAGGVKFRYTGFTMVHRLANWVFKSRFIGA